MKLVDDDFTPNPPQHYEVNLSTEQCATILGVFCTLAVLEDLPEFFNVATKAVSSKPTRIERSFAVLKWTKEEAQAVLQALMNYVNAGTHYIDKYGDGETFKGIRDQLDHYKELSTLCYDILHQVERQGFVSLDPKKV